MKKPANVRVSRRSLLRRAILLLVVFLLAGAVSVPQASNWVIDQVNAIAKTSFAHVNVPLVLGLDLQGGTRLEYSADLSRIPEAEKADAMAGVRDVIERRVNAMGVSEPIVLTSKAGNDWRLSVELAGISDVNQAIRTIGETPTLDFRVENPDAGRALTQEEETQLREKNEEVKQKAEAALAEIQDGASFEDVAKKVSEDEASKANGGDLGFLMSNPTYRGLADFLQTAPVGTVVDRIVDDGTNMYVAKVEETKDAGQEIRASHLLIGWKGADRATSTSTKEEARARIEEIASKITPENFDEMARQYSEEPDADRTSGDLDWFRKGVMVQPFEDAVFAMKKGDISAMIETPFGFHLIKKTDERPLLDLRVRAVVFRKALASDVIDSSLWKRTGLTGKDLQRAQLDFDQQTGQSQVALQFNAEGTKLFAELTKDNVGKPIGIFLDDEPISTPRVNQVITGGQAVISGSFTLADAKLLAQRLQAGALPVPISIISEQTVGPTLGGESVAASVRAGLFGFLFVALFMLLFYRLPGVLAVTALTFYAAVLLALFKLIPVTMTLSGIAGFILSLGMAVDANVLIFERLKEELRSGKAMGAAIDEAFKRAWLSIRDGNATTLISCAVLYGFSSSIIRGFALTLAIGVLVSMFSAIIVTRVLLKLVARPAFVAKMPWLFLVKSKDGSSI